ncbi:hypothetical protein PR048_028213 [Dryococelus australis]|uniref:Uncharacterized protein n=1 Tax=Dryococelus australis TaxID=614101 RepID=A0ABQ9GIM1_9NEOP|nr:hypothetical protein PR048_028213 [Dryococelus australis]
MSISTWKAECATRPGSLTEESPTDEKVAQLYADETSQRVTYKTFRDDGQGHQHPFETRNSGPETPPSNVTTKIVLGCLLQGNTATPGIELGAWRVTVKHANFDAMSRPTCTVGVVQYSTEREKEREREGGMHVPLMHGRWHAGCQRGGSCGTSVSKLQCVYVRTSGWGLKSIHLEWLPFRKFCIHTCAEKSGMSAGFLGDLPFPLPLHPSAAPYSPRFTVIGSQDLDQDNTRPHIARVSLACLHDVKMRPWSASSLDLSPIENVWDHIGWQLRSAATTADLEGQLWQDLSQDNILRLYASMPGLYIASCANSPYLSRLLTRHVHEPKMSEELFKRVERLLTSRGKEPMRMERSEYGAAPECTYHPPTGPEKDFKIRRSLQHGSIRSFLLTCSVVGSQKCVCVCVRARAREAFGREASTCVRTLSLLEPRGEACRFFLVDEGRIQATNRKLRRGQQTRRRAVSLRALSRKRAVATRRSRESSAEECLHDAGRTVEAGSVTPVLVFQCSVNTREEAERSITAVRMRGLSSRGVVTRGPVSRFLLVRCSSVHCYHTRIAIAALRYAIHGKVVPFDALLQGSIKGAQKHAQNFTSKIISKIKKLFLQKTRTRSLNGHAKLWKRAFGLLCVMEYSLFVGLPSVQSAMEPRVFCEIVVCANTQQRHGGNTARLARRSDEALGVRVSVARIAPSLLDLGRRIHPTLKLKRPVSRSEGAVRATLTRTPSASSLLRARRAVFPSQREAVTLSLHLGKIPAHVHAVQKNGTVSIRRNASSLHTCVDTIRHVLEYTFMDQRRNEGVGETEDSRENLPTSGIVRHDSPILKSGNDPV